MSNSDVKVWTHEDFEEMSWHDNHVHGLSLTEGEHGSGTVSFDIDFILDWIKRDSGDIAFSIAPADLTFHEVTNLVVHIDYEKPAAALTPFSLDSIDRVEEQRQGYTVSLWKLNLNWPEGYISFEASGYVQTLKGEAVIKDQQVLAEEERRDG